MPLKTIIMNIITLGYYGLQEFSKMRKEEVEKAKALTEKAQKLSDHFERVAPRMVPLQIYDTNSTEYLRRISEFANDPAVKFFLYNIQQDVYEMLNTATDEKAVEIMGMSKGIKYLLRGVESTRMQYNDMMTPKQPETAGEQVYV